VGCSVFLHVRNDDIGKARDVYNTMLKEPDLHLLFQVKCLIMLAGFADIPPIAEKHFNDANQACEELWVNKKEGDEEEILVYATIIQQGLRDLGQR